MKESSAKPPNGALLKLESGELGLDVDIAETLASRGIDSAQLVKVRKPELYRAAMKMLGYGITPKTVETLLGLDIRIVLAILEEGSADGTIPLYKERTIKQLRAVVTLGLDSLLDKAKEGKIDAISLCALMDKVELLSGGLTSRIGVVEDPSVAEFRRFMEASQARGMVLEEGGEFQKAAAAAPELAAGGTADGLEGLARDFQSSVLDAQPVDNE